MRIIFCALALLLCAPPASAALNAYMRITAESQGTIKGSVAKAGREDAIMIIGISHEVTSPRDAASGLPTGKRQHKPFTITLEIDKSSPLLKRGLKKGAKIAEATLKVKGQKKPITLKKGYIAAHKARGKKVRVIVKAERLRHHTPERLRARRLHVQIGVL